MTGFVTEISAEQIGLASQHSGAGRATKDEDIDLSAGISLKKKVGDPYKEGEVLALVFGQDLKKVERGAQEAEKAFTIGKSRVEPNVLIKRIIT
jgi:pyrimidine-nucleoside phosphorylase